MLVQVVKSKIHRVKVTGADLNYVGSVTIDEDLMNAANIIEGERIQIVNNNNGERLETYVIPGPRKSGEITLNGAAARKVAFILYNILKLLKRIYFGNMIIPKRKCFVK